MSPGSRLLLEQLKAQAAAIDGIGVLTALQRVTGPLVGKAPFLRKPTESRECEMRWPVRRSISSQRRGKVQFVRLATGLAKSSPATRDARLAL
ncbi:MAG TPA: hypothetical protein VGT81_19160 [Casimicrobiaceae bacterium]|nr:hypothetical protein [Casimicrobiaceae bacterium]